jgi:DNA-binding transcriptional MerR regulator
MAKLTRKDVAKKLGVGIETLRYYEKLGLISKPERTSSGYRIYSDKDVSSLDHILHIRRLGFSLKEILLFIKKGDQDKEYIKAGIAKKIKDIEDQVESYEKQKSELLLLLQHYQ